MKQFETPLDVTPNCAIRFGVPDFPCPDTHEICLSVLGGICTRGASRGASALGLVLVPIVHIKGFPHGNLSAVACLLVVMLHIGLTYERPLARHWVFNVLSLLVNVLSLFLLRSFHCFC